MVVVVVVGLWGWSLFRYFGIEINCFVNGEFFGD